jgi:hypothetical protein
LECWLGVKMVEDTREHERMSVRMRDDDKKIIKRKTK